ncbi:hypothetical protein AMTR_s00018p00051170, partial [Amborella trichopoda]
FEIRPDSFPEMLILYSEKQVAAIVAVGSGYSDFVGSGYSDFVDSDYSDCQ